MSYKGLYLALFLLLFPLESATAGGGIDADPEKEITLIELSPDMQVEARCGSYFGYETIPGTDIKRILFNYESNDKLLFRAVAYTTIRTEIDDGKEAPTVEYKSSGEILTRISERDYQREKDCLPPPEKPEPDTN